MLSILSNKLVIFLENQFLYLIFNRCSNGHLINFCYQQNNLIIGKYAVKFIPLGKQYWYPLFKVESPLSKIVSLLAFGFSIWRTQSSISFLVTSTIINNPMFWKLFTSFSIVKFPIHCIFTSTSFLWTHCPVDCYANGTPILPNMILQIILILNSQVPDSKNN